MPYQYMVRDRRPDSDFTKAADLRLARRAKKRVVRQGRPWALLRRDGSRSDPVQKIGNLMDRWQHRAENANADEAIIVVTGDVGVVTRKVRIAGDDGVGTPYDRHLRLFQAAQAEFGDKVWFGGIWGERPYCTEHKFGNAVDIMHQDGDAALNKAIVRWLEEHYAGQIGELCHTGNDELCNGYHGNHVHVSLNPQFC
jgi:hypothetical protein